MTDNKSVEMSGSEEKPLEMLSQPPHPKGGRGACVTSVWVTDMRSVEEIVKTREGFAEAVIGMTVKNANKLADQHYFVLPEIKPGICRIQLAYMVPKLIVEIDDNNIITKALHWEEKDD